jgi:hypothetical protein
MTDSGRFPTAHPTKQTTMEIRELSQLLLRGRNADGGWGYYQGKASRLEPTCWSVLALSSHTAPGDLGVALRTWPSEDGLLVERHGGEPNYAFHGLALLVLGACGLEHVAGTATLVRALQRVKGKPFADSWISRQDNSLQGWSWIADTFSWVEPTAWCLLATKKQAAAAKVHIDRARILEAERLLLDRAMLTGGWNYGNSNMLGQQLVAYVPTTAVALLAMQDRRSEPSVERGLAYLVKHATTERSGSALALAALALQAYGHPFETVRAALMEQLPVSAAMGSQAAIATALFALQTGDAHAFRL